MKIIIDVYGGDHSPHEMVKGAIEAINEKEGFDIVLVGKEGEINSILQNETYDKTRVMVENATEVITCEESPTEAIRVKKDSSIVRRKRKGSRFGWFYGRGFIGVGYFVKENKGSFPPCARSVFA